MRKTLSNIPRSVLSPCKLRDSSAPVTEFPSERRENSRFIYVINCERLRSTHYECDKEKNYMQLSRTKIYRETAPLTSGYGKQEGERHANQVGHVPGRNVRDCTRRVKICARSRSRVSRPHKGFPHHLREIKKMFRQKFNYYI